MNTEHANKQTLNFSALVVLALMASALVAAEARSEEIIPEIVVEAQAMQPTRIRVADARKANEAAVRHAAEVVKTSTRDDLDIRLSGHTSLKLVGEFAVASRDRG